MTAVVRTVFRLKDHERWYTVKRRYWFGAAFAVGYTMLLTPYTVRWPLW